MSHFQRNPNKNIPKRVKSTFVVSALTKLTENTVLRDTLKQFMKFQFQKRSYLLTNKENKHEKKYQSHPDKKNVSGNDRKNHVDNHITNPGTGIDKSSTKES